MKDFDPLDLRRVPVLPFTAAAVFGVVLALHVAVSPRIFFFVALAVCALCIAALGVFRSKWPVIVGICVFFFALSAYRGLLAINRDLRHQVETAASADISVSVTGRVKFIPDDSQMRSVFLCPVAVHADSTVVSSANQSIRVYADSAEIVRLRTGDVLTVRGRLIPAISAARGSTGQLITALTRGELATVIADPGGTLVLEAKGFTLRRGVDRARVFIRETFNLRLSLDAAALCRALVLGDRSSFSDVFSDRLRLTGLSHVFALSGVNVGVVVTVIWGLLGLVFVPRAWRLMLMLGVVLFYMELGREAPSLVRATLMAAFFIIGALLHRHGSSYNSVASAALIEVLWRPLDIIDAGFLLSYLAVVGILAGMHLFRPLLLKYIPKRRSSVMGADIIGTTLSAQIATLPLVGYVFHRIPLVGALGNLVAVPLFAVMLIWALLLLAVEAIMPALGTPLAASLNGLAYLAGFLVNAIAGFPLASLAIASFSPALLIGIYAALALTAVGLVVGHKRLALIAVGIAANFILWNAVLFRPAQECRVTFLNVGEGDAALISTANGRHVLIDTGPQFGSWSAADHILRALGERQISRLDAVILSHTDSDHIGGAAEVIRRIPVGCVYSEIAGNTRTFQEFALALEARRIHMTPLTSGQVLRLDEQVSLRVLSPDSTLLASAATGNQRSLVLRLDCGGSSVLFTGDVDSLIEKRLTVWGSFLDVDLLKVSHHGSKTATTGDFLAATSPALAAISSGRRAVRNHPDESVMDRLGQRSIRPFITNDLGDLEFKAVAGGWQFIEQPANSLMRRWHLSEAG